MGEGYRSLGLSFNGSAVLEPGDEPLTSDGGVLGLRELLDRSGVLGWLEPQLHDPRDARLAVYSMGHLLQTLVLMFAQGYEDLSDVAKLQGDPAWSVATSRKHGTEAASDPLPSQASLSRTLTMLAEPTNQEVLDEALCWLAGRRIRAQNGGKRLSRVVLDVDGGPAGARPATRLGVQRLRSGADPVSPSCGMCRDG